MGRRFRLLVLVAIDSADNNRAVVWAEISLELVAVAIRFIRPSTRAKTMGPKVAYHGTPCLWEHENALQRLQDPQKARDARTDESAGGKP